MYYLNDSSVLEDYDDFSVIPEEELKGTRKVHGCGV